MPFERGTGYWKFNNSLLQKQEYLDEMNGVIDQAKLEFEGKNPAQKWELIKKRIKEQTIEYSKQMISENKLIISELSEKLNDYESRLPLNKEETRLMVDTKSDLEEKLMECIKGVMFRSKAKWYEEGEKSSKYFFALEKAKYNAKTCFSLIKENGEEVTNPQEILEEQREFYKKLYEEDKEVKFELRNTSTIKVPPPVVNIQEEQINLPPGTRTFSSNCALRRNTVITCQCTCQRILANMSDKSSTNPKEWQKWTVNAGR